MPNTPATLYQAFVWVLVVATVVAARAVASQFVAAYWAPQPPGHRVRQRAIDAAARNAGRFWPAWWIVFHYALIKAVLVDRGVTEFAGAVTIPPLLLLLAGTRVLILRWLAYTGNVGGR